MITFEIPGRFNTTAQQKGVTIKYGKPYFYEKPEVKALRNQLYFYCKPHRPPQPFGGAVRLKVIFYYKTTKKKQIGQFKTTRPDLDNLNKLLWDVLTDTGFFKDDSQIVIFEARKGYGEEDKIKIEIDEINEEEAIDKLHETGWLPRHDKEMTERPTGEWIPVTTCDMTEEDAKELLDDDDLDDYYDQPTSYWQYNCRLPDDGQEVLVSTKWGVRLTTFYSDVDYGNYFEEYEDRYDVDAWMPIPEPY